MKLLVGLGNPGEKYRNNRHNAGALFVEEYRRKGLPMRVVAAPAQVFMNSSGDAVKKLIAYYKLSLEDLYIVHDDLDIPLGEFKIQKAVGPKDHKGILSIEEKLGTNNFWRIRLGVDARDKDRRIPGESYVLENFSSQEKAILDQVFTKAINELNEKLK